MQKYYKKSVPPKKSFRMIQWNNSGLSYTVLSFKILDSGSILFILKKNKLKLINSNLTNFKKKNKVKK